MISKFPIFLFSKFFKSPVSKTDSPCIKTDRLTLFIPGIPVENHVIVSGIYYVPIKVKNSIDNRRRELTCISDFK